MFFRWQLLENQASSGNNNTTWVQVEEPFNLVAKGILPQREGDANLMMTLDDDKLQCSVSKAPDDDMYGLKQVCHIRVDCVKLM